MTADHFGFASPLLVIRGAVFWPYLEGGVVLLLGLFALSWRDVRGSRGLEKLIPFGPVLYAVAIAVFSGDHFGTPRAVASIVPSWMPWHLFWTYFVGAALIAAALSIAAQKESQLAAAMMGIMLLLFVLMMHIPNCFRVPHERIVYTIAVRESCLSAGAFAYAAALASDWRRGAYRGWGLALRSSIWTKMVTIARVVIGIAIIDFGVQQLLFPAYAPGIPQQGPEIVVVPAWIPAHALCAYVSGAIFLLCGVLLLLNWRPRLIARIFAAFLFVLIAFIYVPQSIRYALNIGLGLNYLAIHFMLAGTVLFLARALPRDATEPVAVKVPAGRADARVGALR